MSKVAPCVDLQAKMLGMACGIALLASVAVLPKVKIAMSSMYPRGAGIGRGGGAHCKRGKGWEKEVSLGVGPLGRHIRGRGALRSVGCLSV